MTTVNPTYLLIRSPALPVSVRCFAVPQGRDITNSQVTAEQTAAIIQREVGRLLQLALAAAQIPGVTPAAGSVYAQAAPAAGDVADAVRAELAAELANLDVAVSSRLAAAGYTAPDNAGIAALPTLAEIEASTVLAKEASIPAVPTSADNAAAILAAATLTPIHADTRKMNGAVVNGDGTSGNKWRGA